MLRNIHPEDAQLTSDVLDRILYLRKDMKIPQEISIALVEQAILLIKGLLALYQPTWAQSIKEGKGSKKEE